MAEAGRDIWVEWLLKRRFGGSSAQVERVMRELEPVRDKVLEHAALPPGGTLLDVGCGDGLIGFGALIQDATCRVVFSDISVNLVARSQALAHEMGMSERANFVISTAQNLRKVSSETIDAVATRSVLIYVAEKQAALDEFYRVLRPGGRLSIFEPINVFNVERSADTFWGYDLGEQAELGERILKVFRDLQPIGSDPMLDFDERDLYAMVIQAGFRYVNFELQGEYLNQLEPGDWERTLYIAGNPKIPNLAEAMETVLNAQEKAEFEAVLRPLVEAGDRKHYFASLYLWAEK